MQANPQRRQLLAAAALVGMLVAGGAPAAAVARLDGSHESTLMAVPDSHPTLMPIPGGAQPSPAAAHEDPMADDHGATAESSDAHGGGHNGLAAPDAAGRRIVIAGFAFVNLFILGAAGTMRWLGKGGRRASGPRTRHTRTAPVARTHEGGAA